jgi:predicted Fe-Mo cluster-binding NifX family protein
MKIAVAVTKKGETSPISDQPGRAAFFLVFDEEGRLLETLKNPFSRGGGGAGFGVAKMLADRQVDLVVAGKFGGNMTGALEERGLRHLEMQGAAVEAVARARDA